MVGPRQRSLCKHCGRVGLHSEERCNQNPASRNFGRTFAQIYTNAKQAGIENKTPASAAAGNSRSPTGTAPMMRMSASRARDGTSDQPAPGRYSYSNSYADGYAAGYAAGLAAASNGDTSSLKLAAMLMPKLSRIPASSCHSVAASTSPRESAAIKWGNFAIAESARTASFKTDEGRRKQQEAFAKAVADEEKNPSKRIYTSTFSQTASSGNITCPRRITKKTKETIVHDGTDTTSTSTMVAAPPVKASAAAPQTSKPWVSSAIAPHIQAQMRSAGAQPQGVTTDVKGNTSSISTQSRPYCHPHCARNVLTNCTSPHSRSYACSSCASIAARSRGR
ncbi:hypothetical protein AC579_2052 [Pseudocercospora musae]|uniref:Uncharacterized protein n=1 Tax=Pseudocercospora musae TaxID=113226 RepID=A0A139IC42_9PEZI|nr:hypothetical protein AC579_2052 [Pseudocercospora musae]